MLIMKWNSLGIVGGLGTETSSGFCVEVNKRIKALCNEQPHLIMENVPMTVDEELRLIHGEPCPSVLSKLLASVERLSTLRVGLIVIPCNSVHIFFDELKKRTAIPLMNIIMETGKFCKEKNLNNVGLIATTTTIQQRLHHNELQKLGINVIIPSEQNFIDSCIERILNNKTLPDDQKNMIEVVKNLHKKGAEAIILGCTDFGRVIKQTDVDVRLIDTLMVLEDVVVKDYFK